ncbi:MAG: glycosyltransferase family 9 protein [Candidatus Gygaella obscura]|nr:glycosyltransferase family 9 protein [Candidatus Gygaella obscura]
MEKIKKIHFDCRFFKGSQPCIYHKSNKNKCINCDKFTPVKERILIIKLDSIGDVLRTTCILPGLKDKYPHAHISWLTRKISLPLLIDNPYIDSLLCIEDLALANLLVEKFDIVINPSNDKTSCLLSAVTCARNKYGFILDKNSRIIPLNKMAEYYLMMAVDDDLKKKNDKTYQEIIYEMSGLKFKGQKPVIKLNDSDLKFAEDFFKKNKITQGFVFGLNTGAGKMWDKKKWSVESTIKLSYLLRDNFDSNIILFGGPDEIDRNKLIMSQANNYLVDAGCDRSLGQFAALINKIDLLITADTLALHIACALGKKIICLFGPTSSSEIDLYNKGIKLYAPELDCLCCYKKSCSLIPDCMDLISSEDVIVAVKKLIDS